MNNTEMILNALFPLSPEELVREAIAAGRPTEGPFAEALWRLLSGNHGRFDAATARALYEEMGYEPFKGYPLRRLPIPPAPNFTGLYREQA
jgi:hypothetical protein